MKANRAVTHKMIAPCGMNCALCRAYLREKNRCSGCRVDDESMKQYRSTCVLKNCEILAEKGYRDCSPCKQRPCKRLKGLDKRYRTKYHMSMIENLDYIQEHGIRKFVRKEKQRWECPECGHVICVHSGTCSGCGYEAFKIKR